jgi:hypothetical protein
MEASDGRWHPVENRRRGRRRLYFSECSSRGNEAQNRYKFSGLLEPRYLGCYGFGRKKTALRCGSAVVKIATCYGVLMEVEVSTLLETVPCPVDVVVPVLTRLVLPE